MPAAGRCRYVYPPQPVEAPGQLPGAHRPLRRGAGGRPHLYLQRAPGGCRPHQQLDGPGCHALHLAAAVCRVYARAHPVRDSLLDGAAGQPHCANRCGAKRQRLRGREHAADDAHGPQSVGCAGGRWRFRALHAHRGRTAGPGCHRCHRLALQPDDEIHRPLPRNARNLELWLGLRRQRPAGQKVPGAAHCFQDGARPGLAGRAHADFGRDQPRRGEAPHCSGLPQRLRQDQLFHAGAAGRVCGLARDHRGRRHRLDSAAGRRQPAGHQPRGRLLWRGAGHQPANQPQLHGQPAPRRDLHQRGADRRWRRVVGRAGGRPRRPAAGAFDRLAGPALDPGHCQGNRGQGRPPQRPFYRGGDEQPGARPGLGRPPGRED